MFREANRRNIPDETFWTLENVRFYLGEYTSRYGLSKVNSGDGSTTLCLYGTTTLPTDGTVPTALMLLTAEDQAQARGYSDDLGVGSAITVIRTDNNNNYADIGTHRILHFEGQTYAGQGDQLYPVSLSVDTGAGEIVGSRGAEVTRVLFGYNLYNMVKFRSVSSTRAGLEDIWMLFSATGTLQVWSWSPAGLVQHNSADLGTDGNNSGTIFKFNENIYVIYADDTNVAASSTSPIMVRGVSATNVTTWTQVDTFDYDRPINISDWTEHASEAWFAVNLDVGGECKYPQLGSFDGTTATEYDFIGTGASCAGTTGLVFNLLSHSDGNLYYVWWNVTTDNFYLGQYNNSTFNNTYKDLTALSSTLQTNAVGYIARVGGDIYISVNETLLKADDPSDLSSTYTEVLAGDASAQPIYGIHEVISSNDPVEATQLEQ